MPSLSRLQRRVRWCSGTKLFLMILILGFSGALNTSAAWADCCYRAFPEAIWSCSQSWSWSCTEDSCNYPPITFTCSVVRVCYSDDLQEGCTGEPNAIGSDCCEINGNCPAGYVHQRCAFQDPSGSGNGYNGVYYAQHTCYDTLISSSPPGSVCVNCGGAGCPIPDPPSPLAIQLMDKGTHCSAMKPAVIRLLAGGRVLFQGDTS